MTDDFISELVKQKIISMIGNMFYDILDINILKTIFCRRPFTPYTILYFYKFCRSYWGANSIPPPNRKFWGPLAPTILFYTTIRFAPKLLRVGWIDWRNRRNTPYVPGMPVSTFRQELCNRTPLRRTLCNRPPPEGETMPLYLVLSKNFMRLRRRKKAIYTHIYPYFSVLLQF